MIKFKDAVREECETYHELYLVRRTKINDSSISSRMPHFQRKMNEYEEKLRQCTASAKRKIAQTVTQSKRTMSFLSNALHHGYLSLARQTKTISFPQMKVSSSANSKGHLASTHRVLVNLPSSRFRANAAKVKSKLIRSKKPHSSLFFMHRFSPLLVEPTIAPLLKKTLKLHQSKNY